MVTLGLNASPEIIGKYGYEQNFTSKITYKIEAERLTAEVEVVNNGSDLMTFSIALHTYLRVEVSQPLRP